MRLRELLSDWLAWTLTLLVMPMALLGLSAAYVFADTSTSVQDGKWSDAGTWDVLPTKDRDVVIKHAVVADKGECRRCDVAAGATLTLGGNLALYDGSLVIRGALNGATGVLAFHVSSDRGFTGNATAGPDPAEPDDHSGTDWGLWCMDGAKVNLSGDPVTSWLLTLPSGDPATSLKYGATSRPSIRNGVAYLSEMPHGWLPDDQLLLISPTGASALATLEEVKCGELEHKILYSGATGFAADCVQAEGRMVQPIVANLTRRLQIVSADVKEGNTGHRAHTIFMGHETINVSGVEFRNLGPRAKLGRYPVHFHHTHPTGTARIQGCSIWSDTSDYGNRFLSVHDTNETAVSDCVGYGSRGHGFFHEVGTERMNSFTRCLSVNVVGPEELKVKDADRLPNTHHFWLRTGNQIVGCAAAGGTQTNGFGYLPHSVPFQPPDPGVFTDCRMYGLPLEPSSKYGWWTQQCQVPAIRPIAAYCGTSAFGGAYNGLLTTPIDTLITDPTLFFNGEKDTNYGSQIYTNGSRGLRVQGGLLVGRAIYVLHYYATVQAKGGKARGGFLVAPTYWECHASFEDMDCVCDWLPFGAYPMRRNAPGLVRVKNFIGTFAGKTYTNTAPYSADFVLLNPAYQAALPSTGYGPFQPFNVARLNGPPPATGFLRFPAGALPSGATWGLAPAGTAPAAFAFPSENEVGWQASVAAGQLGMPEGVPPGAYDIQVKLADGTLGKKWSGVTVTGGQVTALP